MRELGGYLPIELDTGREYFRQIPDEYTGRYDCGRTALYVALCSLGTRTLWVPSFCCPSVISMLETLDIRLKYYRITEEFMPEDFVREDGETILLINYYGILDKKILAYTQGKQNIIVDNTQAFFCEPIVREGIFTIYSCRKFIGVSDGAYVIGPGQQKMRFPKGESYQYSAFLLRSLERGTNDAYPDQVENEKRFGKEFCEMSDFTRRVLDGVDYDRIRERRRSNCAYLHFRLKNYQLLTLEDGDHSPYCYPLLLDKDLRHALIQQHVYVPTLWKEFIDEQYQGTLEYRLAKHVLCLPVDQRYGWEDMEYICQLIEQIRRNA